MICRVGWRTAADVRVAPARAPRPRARHHRRRDRRHRRPAAPSSGRRSRPTCSRPPTSCSTATRIDDAPVDAPRRAPRPAADDRARLRGRHLHVPGHGVQQLRGPARPRARRLPAPRGAATRRSDMAKWPKPPEGSWTEHYPELGTGPVSFEDSISPEFYELEREAIFKRAWLNVGRVEQLPAQGQLLHQGARGREHVGHRRARRRRRDPGLPQHLPPPRQQAGVERLPARGDERDAAASSSASTTAGGTSLDGALHLRAAGGRVLRPRQGRLRARRRCTATCGRGSSSSTSTDGAAPVAARVPRPDDHRRSRATRSSKMTERFVVPRRGRAATGSSSWTPSRSSTTHPSCTRASRRPRSRHRGGRRGFEAPHYEIDGPHRLVSHRRASGRGSCPAEMLKPMETRDPQRPVRSVGRARPRPAARGRQPGERESVGPRLVPDLARTS